MEKSLFCIILSLRKNIQLKFYGLSISTFASLRTHKQFIDIFNEINNNEDFNSFYFSNKKKTRTELKILYLESNFKKSIK